jgi:subtilase family serine protease
MSENRGFSKSRATSAFKLASSHPLPSRLLCRGATLLLLALFSSVLIVVRSVAEADPSPAEASYIVRLPGHVLTALNKAERIQSPENASDQPITLTLVLKRERQTAFERYLNNVYDPRSPNYRHFLTQQEIAARFGPSQKSYDAALAYVEGYGFKLLEGSKNRMTITVRGTRANAERAFHLRIQDYSMGERSFYANDRAPALPASLAPDVEALVGLANLNRPEASTLCLSQVVIRATFTLAELIDAEAAY